MTLSPKTERISLISASATGWCELISETTMCLDIRGAEVPEHHESHHACRGLRGVASRAEAVSAGDAVWSTSPGIHTDHFGVVIKLVSRSGLESGPFDSTSVQITGLPQARLMTGFAEINFKFGWSFHVRACSPEAIATFGLGGRVVGLDAAGNSDAPSG